MKIYYKSKIAKLFTFIDGYKTIMLFGAVFTESDAVSLRTEYHEEAHCNQYHTLFYFGMFISLLTIGLCLLFGNVGWWMLWLSLIPVFLYYAWYLIGMRDLINNADEDVDCVTSATESSIYCNDFFYIFV